MNTNRKAPHIRLVFLSRIQNHRILYEPGRLRRVNNVNINRTSKIDGQCMHGKIIIQEALTLTQNAKS